MSDLDKLQRDLGTVPRYSQRFVHKALGVTANLAKSAWRNIAVPASGERAKGYPFAIDYEVSGDFPSYEAEIGPQLGGQGSLGILEDAPLGVRSAPQSARKKILPEVEADFEKGLDRAVDDALRRAGL